MHHKPTETPPRHRRQSKSDRAHARARALGDFWTGVCLSIVLAIAGFAFEHTSIGEAFQRASYHLLQRLLVPNERVPIQLIDISSVQPDERGVTPRRILKSVIGAVAKQGPKVIGVDIDFSPQGGKLVDWKEDPDFFEYCLSLRHDVPVFLGVLRTAAKSPDEWLGFPEYRDLAAAILVPTESTRSVTRSFGAYRGLTISAALARAYDEEAISGNHSNWLLESESERWVKGLYVKELVVDYSIIPKIRRDSIPLRGPFDDTNVQTFFEGKRDQIADKMVLIGDVGAGGVAAEHDSQCLKGITNDADCQDVFPSPSGAGAIRGILLHAAAAYTTLTNPLYDIREPWRTGADILLAGILLGIILLIRLASGVNGAHLLYLLTGGAVVLVLVIGLLVNYDRVLWDGFLLVAIVLALHAVGEKPFERFRHWLHQWLYAREEDDECHAKN